MAMYQGSPPGGFNLIDPQSLNLATSHLISGRPQFSLEQLTALYHMNAASLAAVAASPLTVYCLVHVNQLLSCILYNNRYFVKVNKLSWKTIQRFFDAQAHFFSAVYVLEEMRMDNQDNAGACTHLGSNDDTQNSPRLYRGVKVH
ncbi:hypothetical protein Ciccas_011268 [Cichlidogyrus casuarinus]|uniref:Uncharacterized protein n=1 Tax=Cichlidogyrus casuarinus TaxID=1844966 RepID=A0ABD2PRQ8_9PLAT